MNPTLGRYLASIRIDRKMTLREVEEATQKRVSNGYLSQIENDRIRKPSPNVLHSLAEIYSISFENLMDRAGLSHVFHRTVGRETPRARGDVRRVQSDGGRGIRVATVPSIHTQ